jgi:hypothetical protein
LSLPKYLLIKNESEKLEKNFNQQKTLKMIDGDPHIEITSRETTPVTKNIPPMVSDLFRQRDSILYLKSTTAKSQLVQENIFVSGLWKYQYQQYNQYHGPFPHQLVFNPKTRTLHGYGEDNVGQYVLNGSFSEATGQIEMIQHYQVGFLLYVNMLHSIRQ